MKAFFIKGDAATSRVELIDEDEIGYRVRIVRKNDDWEDIKEDFLPHELFDTCIRTGYMVEMTG